MMDQADETNSATTTDLEVGSLQISGDNAKKTDSDFDKSSQSPNTEDRTLEAIIPPEPEQPEPPAPHHEVPIEDNRATNPRDCEKEAITVPEQKKKDDKLVIYKVLAIKLKKELVKTREELQKLQEDSSKECNSLKQQVVHHETNTLTLEAKIKSLKQQLENSEADLQVLQNDYESYKIRASKIMQQNTPMPFNNTLVDERYKQLKELSDEQAKHITTLESQLSKSLERNKELTEEAAQLQEQLNVTQEDAKLIATLSTKCEMLSRENENLKTALKQFRTKLKEPIGEFMPGNMDVSKNANNETNAINSTQTTGTANNSPTPDDRIEDTVARLSPSASIKDGSSSSIDGYVHIKPTTFEIVSRSSVLEDAQNQIDNLTKAYLDSESTNSLLSEQVRALKEEIRRMQRVSDRLELAENLEYLKNVVFKFLSLDSNHTEQKQRLIPVLSTVLKLSPDEVAKLHSLTVPDRTSMASSFFKI